MIDDESVIRRPSSAGAGSVLCESASEGAEQAGPQVRGEGSQGTAPANQLGPLPRRCARHTKGKSQAKPKQSRAPGKKGRSKPREKPTLPSNPLLFFFSLLAGEGGRRPSGRHWLPFFCCCIAAVGDDDDAACGVDAGAGVAGDAAVDALLPRLRRPPGVPAQRVQHVLPRLPRRAAAGLLLLLPGAPTRRPPRNPDTAVVVPRRGARLRGGGRPRHHRRPDLRHQQRPGPLPQRAPAAARRRSRRGKGRRVAVQLRDLRPRAARPLPLLLPRMQVGGHQEEHRPRAGHRRRRRHSAGGRRRQQEGTATEGDPAPRALLVLTAPPTVIIARRRQAPAS